MKRLCLIALLFAASPAAAQTLDLGALAPSGNGALTGRIVQMVVVLTVLSIAPGLLVMMTSFTRFVVALSFLRSGLGLQNTPANIILVSLSLFMTFYVMAPTFDRAWKEGLQPLMEHGLSEREAFDKTTAPFRDFMMAQIRPKDFQLFEDFAKRPTPAASETDNPVAANTPGLANGLDRGDLRVVIPAFMISELRRGFEIGFLIALPFLVIDLIVATLTMSMGMMMLPPSVIALPIKIVFFVLIDGWNMLVGSLMRSIA